MSPLATRTAEMIQAENDKTEILEDIPPEVMAIINHSDYEAATKSLNQRITTLSTATVLKKDNKWHATREPSKAEELQ